MNSASGKSFDLNAFLLSQGIDDPLEQERYTLCSEDEAAAQGFPPSGGVLIDYKNLDGTAMMGADDKPFAELRHADGQLPTPGRRYSIRPGAGTHLFLPNRLKGLLATSKFCIVTEGAKKTSVVSCHGFPCVGLIGWTSWRNTGTDELHDDFDQIPIAGRTFYLLPDFDGAFNADIHREVQKLALAIYEAGADKVKLMKLPVVSGEKLGIDDFILSIKQEEMHD